jgi:hypothetical protein
MNDYRKLDGLFMETLGLLMVAAEGCPTEKS